MFHVVSIHALLAECDRGGRRTFPGLLCFNPRTPCGVRLLLALNCKCSTWFQSTHSLRSATACTRAHVTSTQFQSTHSLRSATSFDVAPALDDLVSIHALLAECDKTWDSLDLSSNCFNPRTPCGVRLRPTLYIATQQSKSYFAPTSLKRPSLHGCSF